MANIAKRYMYHIAVSFANEDTNIVEEFAYLARLEGITIFYSRWEQASLWGKDLYQYLDELYRKQALFCLLFISKYYASKAWTKHELRSAQARALIEDSEYILPIRLDETEIPGLPSTIAYINLNDVNSVSLVQLLVAKLKEKGVDLTEEKHIELKKSYENYVYENLTSYNTNTEYIKRLLDSDLKEFVVNTIKLRARKSILQSIGVRKIFKSIESSIQIGNENISGYSKRLISLYAYLLFTVKIDYEFIEEGASMPLVEKGPMVEKLMELTKTKVPGNLKNIGKEILSTSLVWLLFEGKHKKFLSLLDGVFADQSILQKISFSKVLHLDDSKQLDYHEAFKAGVKIRKAIWKYDDENQGFPHEFSQVIAQELEDYLSCWLSIFKAVKMNLLDKEIMNDFLSLQFDSIQEEFLSGLTNNNLSGSGITKEQLEIARILESAFATIGINDLDADGMEIFRFAEYYGYKIYSNFGSATKQHEILMIIDYASVHGINKKLKEDAIDYENKKREGFQFS